ncbi:hypothetical protein CCACVL1_00182, partial [Corchorus capsularis]
VLHLPIQNSNRLHFKIQLFIQFDWQRL